MPVRLVSQEELPDPLNGYRLIERLGRGGFGEVWKVEAPGGIIKAAKFVFGDLEARDEESRPAVQELKALERVKLIRHPYILTLEQFRIIEGQLIIIMELADRNLWDRFRECRSKGLPGIPRDELIQYMEETAEGLDLMNSQYQIQHLDVKPQNLFLVYNHIKVADFGLAKVLDGVRATVTGGVTPVYAAPETFEGWVSRFSDQYSLAIVFQELLTGCRPFNGSNTRQLLMQHINGTPDLNPLPPNDRATIGRALSKTPDERWPTCTELVRTLKMGGAQPAVASPAASGGFRPAPDSAPSTMPIAAGNAQADSTYATRFLGGASQARAPVSPASNPARAPLPPFVTPSGAAGRLVTPIASPSVNPTQTLNRPVVLPTARMGSMGIAPPEKAGDGALFPALVIAIGNTGLRVVQELKRIICDRYESTNRVPHVRLLCLDSDTQELTGSNQSAANLTPQEVLSARLNRSTHYMQVESMLPVDQWMPTGLLYKLPRNPTSASGVRAFGRLAFVDYFRAISQRIREEIATFLTDDPLSNADKATKLGLRSNRPRVYVVANLAGGTGGGMFLDLAYLVRHELRQAGYMRPEVVGVFFVPPADRSSPRTSGLANSFASLAELHHFQAKKSRYQTTFNKSEPPIVDGEPPFARTAVLQLPERVKPNVLPPALSMAARAIFNEMLTPAGRAIDEARDLCRNAFPANEPTCQAFGLYRLSWPRGEVLEASTRCLASRQIQRWTGKESGHLREHIASWLSQQWAERMLSFESIVEALKEASLAALREDPDRVFDAFIEPLRTRTPASGKLDSTSACAVLEQLLKLVGKPECENDPSPGSIVTAMDTRFKELTKETEAHVALMTRSFLDVPHYRVPGAEETLRQIVDRLKLQLESLEPVQIDLSREVQNTYARLFRAIGNLSSTGITARASRKSTTAEVLDLLGVYPRKRLQLHILNMALSVYRKLLGSTPEHQRELNNCRTVLADIQASLAQHDAAASGGGPGLIILPDGCKTLDDAADQFLARLAPDDLVAFDQSLQKDITRKLRSLASICLKPNEKGPVFRDMLLHKARKFLDRKLDHADPATVFFRSRPDDGSSLPLLGEALEEAAPDIMANVKSRSYEIVVIATPPTSDGDRLQMLVKEAQPDMDFIAAPLPEDICFYREFPQVPLASLTQLGENAREAFDQTNAAVGSSHTRTDVPWQLPGT